MVHLSTDILPKNKPRYLMGVGFAVDLVVCSALGVDMYDCVFPSRTAVSITLQDLFLKDNSLISSYITYILHFVEVWMCVSTYWSVEFKTRSICC